MKNLLISITLSQFMALALHAQTHYGTNAGTLGVSHSYFGYSAGNAATNTSNNNSFFGALSGLNTTTGAGNTALGYRSLQANTEGTSNIAIGSHSLFYNTVGEFNVAIGRYALFYNTTSGLYSSGDNTAMGYSALYTNTTGYRNTAVGYNALDDNLTGDGNTAIGSGALLLNTGGGYSTATGNYALSQTTYSSSNASFGVSSFLHGDGDGNSAFGHRALWATDFTCTLTWCSGLGAQTGTYFFGNCQNFENATAVGDNTQFTASNQVRIGNSSITSIGGQVSWSTLSDGRFKKNLKNNVAGLDFINQLNPVSYVVDKDAFDKFLGIPDSLRIGFNQARKAPQRQSGFIAQEVEALVKKSGYVFSGVDAPQNEHDTYTIRYAEFVVPLVKAVQELSVLNDSREKEIALLQEALHKFQEEDGVLEKRPSNAALYQNNPNPFSSSTEIKIELSEATTQAHLVVYNLEGKQLKDIRVNERGKATVKISGNELSAGMYLYALIVDGNVVDTKRLILTK